jgi:hypothetical protein
MSIDLCLELVDAVRCADRTRVATSIDLLDAPAALVVLAAMVDQERTPADLLAWTDTILTKRQHHRFRGQAQPCGTHAAFNRHKATGETPCAACVEGERAYQRTRARRRRLAAASDRVPS